MGACVSYCNCPPVSRGRMRVAMLKCVRRLGSAEGNKCWQVHAGSGCEASCSGMRRSLQAAAAVHDRDWSVCEGVLMCSDQNCRGWRLACLWSNLQPLGNGWQWGKRLIYACSSSARRLAVGIAVLPKFRVRKIWHISLVVSAAGVRGCGVTAPLCYPHCSVTIPLKATSSLNLVTVFNLSALEASSGIADMLCTGGLFPDFAMWVDVISQRWRRRSGTNGLPKRTESACSASHSLPRLGGMPATKSDGGTKSAPNDGARHRS